MSDRINYSSGAPWESVVGYSRAVKTGNHIEVSGTVAADKNGNVIGRGDPFVQTDYIFSRIEKTLEEAGASMKHVVRTRMFVTDISLFKEFGRAHAKYFSEIRPCTSMIEVKGLVAPEFLIEIEVTAIIS